MNRKILVMALIGGGVAFCSFAFRPAPTVQGEHENNLKVLPKDISHDELMQVMHSFEVATGMNCGDCHASSATDPSKMDWAADTEHKQTTIAMMKMVAEMNKQYFAVEGNFKDNYLQSQFEVTCITCHNGHEEPSNLVTIPIPVKR
ncbi:MAG TPA: c-type cytochrome [Flavobacteriales bacterium]|nr:c-type cytochrome [Flavobacteriales bacterium]HRN36811.1 c-type cytochrome [Flavobacteriales bacterium]HRO39646.1 c-type cytochrome [Flavobacteriales bacterium]HRP81985.1 c-type cytochrome [Flavobacteriales bacterium]HRQ86404.1 c-type cytochrome [Flavobacteriales bacterium]